MPPAAYRPEPSLPAPKNWPFPDRFSHTDGTGRLMDGAFEWTGFLYDDHGARGLPGAGTEAPLASSVGTYRYPDGPAAGNGANIFRTAVGLTAAGSWWRVDWTTLNDPNIPIAEFALDTDNSATTGGSAWPAGAGVRSPGIDKALLVSAKGAWLINVASGARTALSGSSVDTRARSFTVFVPRSLMDPAGTWNVRLVAGLANPSGNGFEPVTPSNGALPGEPAVYDVGFRAYTQEPEVNNYWMDSGQANALASGDISPFAATVDWRALGQHTTTGEPMPTGYTNRWYVSSIELGQGVHFMPNGQEDLRPGLLNRVQPYAVYVPTGYTPSKPLPLTWILHSLDENWNQYGSLDPKFVQEACQQRDSICATTAGRGTDGWYFDEAELDFWEVWNRLASGYRLDPERTAISGYSMGGWGTYKIGLAHPDLFAKAVVLEGPVICGLRAFPGAAGAAGPGHCSTDGDSIPVIPSARNLPYVISQGAADELVPLPGEIPDMQKFASLGYRYRYELYPAADHLVYPFFDGFSDQAAHLSGPPRVDNPAHVTYDWYPDLDRPDLGIGSTGAYWLRDTRGRTVAPGTVATLDAVSSALPNPAITPVTSTGVLAPGDPFPAVVTEQSWVYGAQPALRPMITLRLSDVGSLGVDLVRAGIPAGRGAALPVTTDGPVTVTLLRAGPGLPVGLDGVRVGTVSASGQIAVPVPTGSHTISLG